MLAMTGISRIRLAIMNNGDCRPTRLKARIESRITTTRNSVPQRWWAVGWVRTYSGRSGSPASSVWIAMCSAPWYMNTRWMSGVRPMTHR